MAVFRVHKSKKYTTMSNYHLQDMRLSLKAIGLLSKMLSLPENWDYSVAGLVKICQEGKDGITSALKELEKCGYLRRTKTFNENGQFSGYEYEIFEKPLTEKPLTEKPLTEKPLTEKPQQINTKEQNTKRINNTKGINKEVEEIKNFFNETCVSFPKVTVISDNRKKAIKARLNSGYTVDDFKQLFEEAENSSFLKGKNNRDWQATFDWLIKDGNMAKVLDGNYRDKDNPKPPDKTHDKPSYNIAEIQKRLDSDLYG